MQSCYSGSSQDDHNVRIASTTIRHLRRLKLPPSSSSPPSVTSSRSSCAQAAAPACPRPPSRPLMGSRCPLSPFMTIMYVHALSDVSFVYSCHLYLRLSPLTLRRCLRPRLWLGTPSILSFTSASLALLFPPGFYSKTLAHTNPSEGRMAPRTYFATEFAVLTAELPVLAPQLIRATGPVHAARWGAVYRSERAIHAARRRAIHASGRSAVHAKRRRPVYTSGRGAVHAAGALSVMGTKGRCLPRGCLTEPALGHGIRSLGLKTLYASIFR